MNECYPLLLLRINSDRQLQKKSTPTFLSVCFLNLSTPASLAIDCRNQRPCSDGETIFLRFVNMNSILLCRCSGSFA